MLRIDKRELPEYQYEDAVVRDAYNIAARELGAAGFGASGMGEKAEAFSPALC